MNVISNNIFMIPAIHYITTIYTYILVHPLARVPETRLTHYLVARPGATVDGAKYIKRSPQTTEHPTTTVPYQDNRNGRYGYQNMATAGTVRVVTCGFL